MPVSKLDIDVGIFGDFDIDCFEKNIGIKASWSKQKGGVKEFIVNTPNGDIKNTVVNSHSAWVFSTKNKIDTLDLNEHLVSIRQFLTDKKDTIYRYIDARCRLGIRITIYFRRYGAIIIDSHALEILNHFGHTIDFSFIDDLDGNEHKDEMNDDKIHLEMYSSEQNIIKSATYLLDQDWNVLINSFVGEISTECNSDSIYSHRGFLKASFPVCGGNAQYTTIFPEPRQRLVKCRKRQAIRVSNPWRIREANRQAA